MLTGELRSQIDRIWDAFWSGGISNPLEVLEQLAAAEMFELVGESAFPFLRTLGSDGKVYARHMKDARFTIPKPELLARVVDLLDAVPMADSDNQALH